jgi:hypothetical protein
MAELLFRFTFRVLFVQFVNSATQVLFSFDMLQCAFN